MESIGSSPNRDDGRRYRRPFLSHPRVLAVAAALAVVLALIGYFRGSERSSIAVVRKISFGESSAGVIAADPGTGRVFVAQEEVPAIAAYDGATYELLATVPSDSYHASIAVDPNTHRVYVTPGFSGVVLVIDGVTFSHFEIPVPDLVNATGPVAVDPDGHRLYVGRNDNGDVAVFDTTTNAYLGGICPGCCTPYCADAEFNSAAHRVYFANVESDQVIAIDSPSGEIAATIAVPGNPHYLAVDPKSGRLYVSPYTAQQLALIDVVPGSPTEHTVVNTVALPQVPFGLAVDPDRNRIYAANSAGGSVSVIDGAEARRESETAICVLPSWTAVLPALGRVFVACVGSHELIVLEDSAPITAD